MKDLIISPLNKNNNNSTQEKYEDHFKEKSNDSFFKMNVIFHLAAR